jgi:hypothetical protein
MADQRLPPDQAPLPSEAAPPTIVLTASAADDSDAESVIHVSDPADDDEDDAWRAAATAVESDDEDSDVAPAIWGPAADVAAACDAVRNLSRA